MKNIFRFVAVALVASSMLFVACSKDEEDDLASIQWTFGGKTYTAGNILADYDDNYVSIEASVAENFDINKIENFKEIIPLIQFQIPKEKGKFDNEDDMDYLWVEYYHNDVFDYYYWKTSEGRYIRFDDTTTTLNDGETLVSDSTYSEFGAQYMNTDFSGKITDLDATAGTISLNATAKMIKTEDYYNKNLDGSYFYKTTDDIPTSELTITVNNITITKREVSKAPKMHKHIGLRR